MARRLLLIILSCLAACGAPTETREAQALRLLQEALPASTRESQGLPFGGWTARYVTDVMTVTVPLNSDRDIERGLRAYRAPLVRVAARLFTENSRLQHLTLIGTLPYGAGQAEIPMLVGEISRADAAVWDGTSDQLGIWRMDIP